MSLVYSSSKLNYHLYLVCTLTVFKLFPSSWWFILLSKLTSYCNYIWHQISNLLFLWNKNKCWSTPFIIIGILNDGENFLDNLTSTYIVVICIFYGIEFDLTKNSHALFALGKLQILSLFFTNYPSPKTISYILFYKLFWICPLNYGFSPESLSNFCCPTCLTNPSFISLSICGHFMITCPPTLQKNIYFGKSLRQPG